MEINSEIYDNLYDFIQNLENEFVEKNQEKAAIRALYRAFFEPQTLK